MDSQLSIDQSFLENVKRVIHSNLGNSDFGVDELAREIGLSRSQLHRKLKLLEGVSPSELIRETRLKEARKLLERRAGTVAEIAYKTGFSSPSYFNTCFHENYGFSPGKTKSLSPQKFKFSPILKSSIIGLVGFVVASVIFYVFVTEKNNASDGAIVKTIAILRFDNLSNDPTQQYFADGVADDILNHLSRVKGLKTISNASINHLRDKSVLISEIASELNIHYLLDGKVQKFGDNVRVFVQLIEADSKVLLWSQNFDRKLADIFLIQSQIAKTVAIELSMILSSNEIGQIDSSPTNNIEAYNYYLMGRHFWKKRTKKDLIKSIEFYKKAIEIDQNYALAYAGIADSYLIMSSWKWIDRNTGYSKLRENVAKALEISPDLPEAMAVFGYSLCMIDYNWKEGGNILKRTTEMYPNYPVGNHYYSEYLEIIGDFEGAIKYIQRAIDLDPLSIIYYHQMSAYYYRAGDYQNAYQASQKKYALDPNWGMTHERDFRICMFLKKEEEAIQHLKKQWRDILQFEKADVEKALSVYEEKGIDSLFLWKIKVQGSIGRPYPANLVHLGKYEEAIERLEAIFEGRGLFLPKLKNDIHFKPLRSHERYLALMSRLGLVDSMVVK
jgi:TolB-like protein/AraC-like DNA-binding protein